MCIRQMFYQISRHILRAFMYVLLYEKSVNFDKETTKKTKKKK